MKKYENGYQDKINYYQGQAIQAIAAGDQTRTAYFMRKMEYFMTRQAQLMYNHQILDQLA